jgi:hypothetical protein
VTARHQRQLAKARARRQRGQAGHRWLPDTRSLTRRWTSEGHCQYRPGQVAEALAAEGELLHARAGKLAVRHMAALCEEYRLEPETVLNVFGVEIHAAALVTAHYDNDCLYRQLRAVRRFLNRPDVRAVLADWHSVREAS